MRQSYSENRLRQSSAELPAANGKHAAAAHAQPQHAKQQAPPQIPADHHFLSDDENSASGSDEDKAGAKARKQLTAHAPEQASVVPQAAVAPQPAKQAQAAQQPEAAASPPMQVCTDLAIC